MGVLSGKVAVVTGAGRGIGREVARSFAHEGAAVVVNDLGGAADGTGSSRVADDVVAEIRAVGGIAEANIDSVATVAGGEAIFQTAMDSFGACDILVNNAGILRDRTLFNLEEDDWDAVIDVHLKGHYCCSRPFARYIRETVRSDCRIINFSSVSGLTGNFGQANYGSAKAGIAGFMRVVALELARYKCTVNCISPGAVTRLTEDLMRAAGRAIDTDDPSRGPQQIAPVVTWLASAAAAGITSQIFHIAEGAVGIMQQPAVIASRANDQLWTLEQLDRVMPELMQVKAQHDERVAREGEPV